MYFSSFPLLPYTLDEGETWEYLRDVSIRTRVLEENFSQAALYNYYAVSDGATPEDIATEVYGTPYLHWVIFLVNDIIDPLMEWPWNDEALREVTWGKYRTPALRIANMSNYAPPGSVFRQKKTIAIGTKDLEPFELQFPTIQAYEEWRITSEENGYRVEDVFEEEISAAYKYNPQHLPLFIMSDIAASSDFIVGPITVDGTDIVANVIGIEWPPIEEVMNERHHIEDEQGNVRQENFQEGGFLLLEPGDTIITNYQHESRLNEVNREIRILRPEYLRSFIQEFKRLINE